MRTSLSVFCFLAMVCVAEEDVVGGGWWVCYVLCVVGVGWWVCYVYHLCPLAGSFADGSWDTAGEDGGEESAEAGGQAKRCGSRHSLLTQ